ncbi:PIN domain-containing protein [Rubrobacter taiwanensis]|jgi:predicted nucleic acid-binding protein|uniref:PIN domain-containing protein n=1 Tax=Rubrobacter taiwanensis TaxID=185139 RepID=A0A4R1BSB2_9ACTN|nr:PIN domain-containing protein [Rubrobacter taiwanensis]TCJ20267.1 PIN domain-containing protein [Rubrobacter taiwanensis]
MSAAESAAEGQDRQGFEQRFFVDTNLFIYAYDESAGEKRERARALVAQGWEQRRGCVSVQVLQELYANLTRKVAKPLPPERARQIVQRLLRWRVHTPPPEEVLRAIDLHRQADISFWDAMILTSARSLGCKALYSEDLNAGQSYGGVVVINPFAGIR